MRLKQHRLIRPFALAATAVMLAMAVALVWGTGVGFAADYQDGKQNVCEGTFSPGSCEWGSHVTGNGENVALGDGMMPALTSGNENVALDFGALEHNTTGTGNVALGTFALFNNTEGIWNIASGPAALYSNTTGFDNLASGAFALERNTSGVFNLASGAFALQRNTGSSNLASGDFALQSNTTGTGNNASGVNALHNNTTGSANVGIGDGGGSNLTIGNNNIDISNAGAAAEEGTTRIGTEGNQTRAYIAGIHSTSISGCTVQVTEEGQLGCNPTAGGPTGPTGATGATGATGPSASAAIATFASFGGVGSGKCLNYTDLAGQGTGSCPAKTTGYSMSGLLAGPTPAGGATVTNLYADSNATVKGSDTALVAVIDNTTGATLLSCKVDSTTVNHCSNTTESGSAAAGENIEVKVTATPANGSGNSKSWRVRFRY
jgi:hypothetical protein